MTRPRARPLVRELRDRYLAGTLDAVLIPAGADVGRLVEELFGRSPCG